MSDPRDRWQPLGGLPSYVIDGEDLDHLPRATADTGVRNGMPEWKPYVRNPAIRARELQVEAMLESVRAGIRDEIGGGEAG